MPHTRASAHVRGPAAAVEVVGRVNTLPTSPLLLTSNEALRAAIARLREHGIDNPAELARVGCAAMIERCCDAYEAGTGASPGWLAAAVKAGGRWAAARAPRRRESASDLIRALDGGS